MSAQDTVTDAGNALNDTIQSITLSVGKAIDNGINMSESQTESMVIDKILGALGYDLWQYQKQGVAEGIGNIPDYTILPHTPHQWFLEVKKWKAPLTEKDASQTVNYAHNQGNRWAVLTNGDQWRIYDAHSPAPLTEKCILTIPSLTSKDTVDILLLLAKAAMLEDSLGRTYRKRVIRDSVRAQLSDINSQTIKILRRTIEGNGLANVTRDEVMDALEPLHLDLNRIHQLTETGANKKDSTATEPVHAVIEPSLYNLICNQPSPDYKQVYAVIFPDGKSTPALDWRDVAREIVQWCADQYILPPLPFRIGTRGHTVFLNNEPVQLNGASFHRTAEVMSGERRVFIDTNRSAMSFCRNISNLLETVGADPSAIQIRMSEQEHSDPTMKL